MTLALPYGVRSSPWSSRVARRGRPICDGGVHFRSARMMDEESVHRRDPGYLPDRFPVPVDLVVLTEEEWRHLPDRAPRWHGAIADGREI